MIKKILFCALVIVIGISFFACGTSINSNDSQKNDKEKALIIASLPVYKGDELTSKNVVNKASAYISPQCYTKTQDNKNNVFNPCYSCHINSVEPNYTNDYDLQESYAFNENSKINPSINNFRDKTSLVEAISDDEIISYINKSNYIGNNRRIILADILTLALPNEWDMNYGGKKDGIWSGYIPDCYFNFDNDGFDKDNNGEYTGWRVFAYRPFLGTFWPTNGSTDDVIIRLPESMRKDLNGNFSKEIYKINFAIVESMIKRKDISLGFEIDESDYKVDLNHNGQLDKTSIIVYKWNTPTIKDSLINYKNFYVGKAKNLLEKNQLHIAPGLYPEGTEFLHSVRYVGINKSKTAIKMANRMKELRYAKKNSWNTYSQLSNAANEEIKESDAFPDRISNFKGDMERGLSTGLGWIYQGFIEDANGNLRPQTYEETITCMGCHSGIGATTDSTFAFPRKFNSSRSWYHWNTKSLVGTPDKILSNGKGEYAFYLENNKAGDEFRSNEEVKNKFFDKKGNIIKNQISKVSNDITYLIFPSVKRALMLNKAYKVIVNEQSFIYGKDAYIKPVESTVYKEIEIDKSTGINTAIQF